MPRENADGVLTLRGVVDVVFFAGPQFSAGRLLTTDEESVTFAGRIYARKDEPVVLKGNWTQHPKFGRQFHVESMEYDLDLDVEGLARYLANHPDIKGIGPVKAKVIAEKFGGDFERFLSEEPEAIAKTAKLSMDAVKRLRDEWQKTREYNKVITWLAAFELTHHQVTTLIEKYRNNVLGLLQDDPYIMVREIRGLAFKRIDKIARRMGTPKEHPNRIRAGILQCVEEAYDQGDCWVEYEELIDRANTILVMDVLDSRERIEKILDAQIDGGTLACSSHGGRFLVSRPDILRMAHDLAAAFMGGSKPNPHFCEEDDLDELVSRVAPTLNDAQQRAVLSALSHRISVISGAGGSGKTYTVSAITRAMEECDLQTILAAPTGKAAKRMEEVVGIEASTIHRLLGFDGKTYSRGPDNPIEADMVIVDELSMVDVPLAWQLFQCIDLENTAVVLVGDHNQLPPIGPGNVLRDLIDTQAVPTVILDKVVRQAGVLKENSIAVLKGEIKETSEVEPSGRRVWYVVDQFTDQMDAQRFLLDLFRNVLNERLGFDLLRDVQVLTPTNKGPLGTKELNIHLQKLLQEKLWGVEVPMRDPCHRPKFLVRDKVIQTRNNYKLGVMNGTTGFVRYIGDDGSMTIEFDGEPVDIEACSMDLQDIGLAYALTTHRAQGSEFPCVVFLVHKAHSFMHHRNLLYTGVTRAQETAILLGDRWGMRNCAQKRHQENRKTFLSQLLVKTSEETVRELAHSVASR